MRATPFIAEQERKAGNQIEDGTEVNILLRQPLRIDIGTRTEYTSISFSTNLLYCSPLASNIFPVHYSPVLFSLDIVDSLY